MKRSIAGLVFVSLIAAAVSCYRGYPPRINLTRYGTIGLVQFRSEAKGNIAEYATRIFLEVLVQSQPGARIKDLGREDEVLQDIGANRMSPEALEDLGRKYNVDAVFLGTLDVSNIRPRVDLVSIITSLSVSAEVDAVMTARLLDTQDGTALWTDSAGDSKTVAQVSVWRDGGIFFDARDPERAYGSLIRSLVARMTRDFRWW